MALLPAANDPPPQPIDEITSQQPIMDTIKAAVDRKDYKALSAMETEFRRT